MREGWAETTLGKVTSRVTERNKIGNGNVLTISAQYGLVSQEEFFQRRVASTDTRQYYLLRDGDFAYNKSYSEGYPAGVARCLDRYENGIVSPLYICFRPDDEQLDSNFLNHYFESGILDDKILWIAKEGVRNHGLLNVKVCDFFSLPIQLPPLAEQRRIAEILDALDEQIKTAERVLGKELALWEGLLNSQLADHADRFDLQTLKSLTSGGIYGSSAPSVPRDDKLPRYVRITDIDERGGLNLDPMTVVSLPREVARPYFLEDGDLLVARTGFTTGKSLLFRESYGECAFAGYLVRFRFDREVVLPEYGFLWTRGYGFKRWVLCMLREVGQRNISASEYNTHMMPTPHVDVQQALVNAWLNADQAMRLREREIGELQKLKSALMDDLLTGRVRVPESVEG